MSETDEPWVQAPTKTYRGYIGPDGAATVTMDDGSGARRLLPEVAAAGFTWGEKGRTPGENQLALAILDDALGDADEATRVYQRFKHRTVALWSAGAPWTITLREIIAIVADIKDVERNHTAKARAIVGSQVAPVVNEGGGFPGAPIRRSDKDQGPGPVVERQADPAQRAAREAALAKLTDEERRALGL
jgi:hypothetical protein